MFIEDIIITISEYITTRDMLSMSIACKYYKKILFSDNSLVKRWFTLRKHIDSLKFFGAIS